MIRLYLFGGYELKTLILDDEKFSGDIGGLKITYQGGSWYAEAGPYIAFSDKEERLELKNGYYHLRRSDTYYDLHLWVTDKPIQLAAFKKRDLFIGTLNVADIRINDPLDEEVYLFIKGDKIVTDLSYVYVAGKRYTGESLKDNDRIDIPGLSFYYHYDFLLIDTSLAEIDLEPYELKASAYQGAVLEVSKRYVEPKRRPTMSYTIELVDKQRSEEAPFLVTFGQGLFTSTGMVAIAFINAYINYQNGRSFTESALVVAMPLMMAVASLFFPLIQKAYRKRKERRDITAISDANRDKIEALVAKIKEDMAALRAYYEGFALTASELRHRLKEGDLYGLGKKDEDFLAFAVMRSSLKTGIEIKQTGTNTAGTRAIVDDLMAQYDVIKNVPVPINLKNDGYVTVLLNKEKREETLLYILLSLVLKTSYEEFNIALMVDDNFLRRYPSVKNLPHIYDGDVRHLYRKKISLATKDTVVLSYYPQYEDLPEGMSYIYFCEDDEIPKPTKRIIDLRKTDSTIKSTVFSYETDIFYKLRGYSLAKKEIEAVLLKDIYPLDMPLDRLYGKNDGGLKCVLGVSEDGRLLRFDLTERGIGPHGLIGGSTGSGKSEFILAMILSLCLGYTAKELNIAIIDYKGTGLVKALSYQDEVLPHINIALSNLDEIDLDRSLAYFKLECKRREAAFSRLAAISRSSIMDIDDYNRLDPENYDMPYIPRLFIIIDEFAELKTGRPEFIHDIVSLARIGRSLGVSLLLATQKPSAVVDQEIWANTAFKVALRVQDATDSKEVIGTADAAYIRRPGEFYLTSGGDMYHGLGIFTRSFIDERNHEKVSFLDDELKATKTMTFVSENQDRQLTHYIKEIIAYHKTIGYVSNDIYKKRLTDFRFIDVLADGKVDIQKGEILLGIDDDFKKMNQDIVKLDILKNPYVIFSYDTPARRRDVFDLALTSLALHARDIHPIIIGEDRYDNFGEWIEKISYSQEDDVIFLFDVLKEVSSAHVVVFVEDYMRFIQEDRYKEAFEKTIFSLDGKNVSFIIASFGKLSISHKLDNIFTKLVFGSTDKENLIYAFGTYDVVSEEAVYMKGEELVGFKMAQPPRLEKSIRAHTPLIAKIPASFEMEEYLLGYDIYTRKRVHLPETIKILFAYYYEEIGERFKRRLVNNENYEIMQVKEIDNSTYHDLIVWVGPGIGNQYLFVPKIKGDLAANEAYCVLEGTAHVVRYE